MARPEVILVAHNPDTPRSPFAQILERPDWVNGSYSHEDRDNGGFWQCEFKLQRPEDELDYYFDNGLDWSVTPVAESGKTLFEGFIDEFEYQKRGIVKRRRLGRMGNEVWVRYSDGVTSGLRSTVFDDALLQEQYGIKQRVFSGSKMLGLGQADQAAGVLFNRVRSAANPSVSSVAKASDQVALTVRCKGWFHKLYWHVYNNPTGSGTIAAYAQIEAMLDSLGNQAVVNYCLNPSFEVNVTDDWTFDQGGAGGSSNLDATQYYVGAKSCRIRAGTDYVRNTSTVGVSVPNNSTVTVHCRVRCSADPTPTKVWLRVNDNISQNAVAYATAASNGAWEYITASKTNTSGGARTFYLELINYFSDSAADVWFDACQLSLADVPYTDGTLPNCGWSGAAHNSTSWRKTMPYIDHREIQRNDTAVQQKLDGDMTIGDLAMNTAGLGDAFYQLWLVGARERRTFFFEPWAASRLA